MHRYCACMYAFVARHAFSCAHSERPCCRWPARICALSSPLTPQPHPHPHRPSTHTHTTLPHPHSNQHQDWRDHEPAERRHWCSLGLHLPQLQHFAAQACRAGLLASLALLTGQGVGCLALGVPPRKLQVKMQGMLSDRVLNSTRPLCSLPCLALQPDPSGHGAGLHV